MQYTKISNYHSHKKLHTTHFYVLKNEFHFKANYNKKSTKTVNSDNQQTPSSYKMFFSLKKPEGVQIQQNVMVNRNKTALTVDKSHNRTDIY